MASDSDRFYLSAEGERYLASLRPWVIFSTDERLFWSNVDGWVDPASADRFSDDERRVLNLPIGGTWVRVG